MKESNSKEGASLATCGQPAPARADLSALLNLGAVRETVIERGYFEVDRPARRLFEGILLRATLLQVCGEFSFDHKIRGAPELKRDPDGFLYPVQAVIEIEMDAQRYVFELRRSTLSSTPLTVRIYCHPKHLDIAEQALKIGHQDLCVAIAQVRQEKVQHE